MSGGGGDVSSGIVVVPLSVVNSGISRWRLAGRCPVTVDAVIVGELDMADDWRLAGVTRRKNPVILRWLWLWKLADLTFSH